MKRLKYRSDAGFVHPIRVSNKVAAVTGNAETTAAIDSPIKVKISKSNREHGIRPRGVKIYREVTGGTGDDAVTKVLYAFIPILQLVTMDAAAFAIGATITYDGQSWKVLDSVKEDY